MTNGKSVIGSLVIISDETTRSSRSEAEFDEVNLLKKDRFTKYVRDDVKKKYVRDDV